MRPQKPKICRDQTPSGRKERTLHEPLIFTRPGGLSSLRLLGPLVLASLMIPACIKVGPDFVKPEAPVEEKWIDSGNPKIAPGVDRQNDWWKLFNDPELSLLVEKGYQQNLSLQAAGVRILDARARLGIAVGRQYPQRQEAFGGYSREQFSQNSANVPLQRRFDFFSVGFDTAWEMDFWGRFRRDVESAHAELGAAIADYDDLLVSLVAEIASTYVRIRAFEERLEVARSNVSIQQQSQRIANARFRGGAVTELDVAQATALLRSTQSTIPPLQAARQQARNALATLLGVPPGQLKNLLGAGGKLPTAPSEVAVGIPAALLRRRPDIRSVELQAAAQSAQIGVAKADLFPALSLTGTVAFDADDAAKVFRGNSLAGSAGPSFQWPVLNYGRLKDNVRVQDARFQQLIITYQDTVLRAQKEVEDAITSFLQSQEEAKFLSDSVQAAKRSFDLALIQYREGTINFQPVLDTQEFLLQQQERLTNSRADVPLSLIALFKALGGGWEMRKGKDFVSDRTKAEMKTRTDWGDLLSRKEVESPPWWEPDFGSWFRWLKLPW